MKFVKKYPEARSPRYATEGSGCFDIACVKGKVVPARGSAVFNTGLIFEVPTDKVMAVFSRSGHGFSKGIRLANCTGLIDSDYRGEVMVKLTNDTDTPVIIEDGERIAQALLFDAPKIELMEMSMEELTLTQRGTGGLGSTGIVDEVVPVVDLPDLEKRTVLFDGNPIGEIFMDSINLQAEFDALFVEHKIPKDKITVRWGTATVEIEYTDKLHAAVANRT